ncbi:hypothetical protein B0T14DRAFT_565534 [Immersiella caudata]|uniref:Uncharacterized protein n=1 Tax=Immersiella caudata TaxID=314043 RepID=A0AA40C3P9_9PEZI|nr:hypothetical protein B0T14DRAFT_565534 [Immersiella caudata]
MADTPVLYQASMSARTAILIAPAVSQLGPVLQDAVAAIQARDQNSGRLYNINELTADTFVENLYEDTERLEQLNESYRADLDLVASRPADYVVLTRGITPSMAPLILRLNEATQHVIDVYEQSRFRNDVLQARVDTPVSDTELASPDQHHIYRYTTNDLTLSERRRLAQGFIRRERQLELFTRRAREFDCCY